jgi:hypothetical protein
LLNAGHRRRCAIRWAMAPRLVEHNVRDINTDAKRRGNHPLRSAPCNMFTRWVCDVTPVTRPSSAATRSLACWCTANRDPAALHRPLNRFDPHTKGPQNTSFGAFTLRPVRLLARLELKIALAVLFERCPNSRL